MQQSSVELRREKYFQLSSHIAQLDNGKLRSLLGDRKLSLWGLSCPIIIEQSRIFFKRIPISRLEYENLFTTKNLYNLPTCFNYGIGSAGINIFRELVTHQKTTHWVLEEEIANFPLMYHYRVMQLSEGSVNVGRQQLKDFLDCWGNDEAIENYMLDKAKASYELVLFVEYIPQVLDQWLCENPQGTQASLNELCRIIAFLETKGISHFDAHFQNVLTDGEQLYLTDFGLVLDRSFSLSPEEETFYEQNLGYDYAEILLNLGHMVVLLYDSCPEDDKRKIRQAYDLQEDLRPHELRAILLNKIEQIQADGMMQFDPFLMDSVVKYHDIIQLMHSFFAELREGDKKTIKFPQKKLRLLLEETGFLEAYSSPG